MLGGNFFSGMLAIFLSITTVCFAQQAAIEGDYRGRIRITGFTERAGVLHIRKQGSTANGNMIAVLAVANERGDHYGEMLPYQFSEFTLGDNDHQGTFTLRVMAPRNGIGIQIVSLEVDLDPSGNQLTGHMVSNLINPDGELIESNFEFKRDRKA